jgi:hypothetical protein
VNNAKDDAAKTTLVFADAAFDKGCKVKGAKPDKKESKEDKKERRGLKSLKKKN